MSWNMDITPEVDPRVTKDGVTICFHDKNFKQIIPAKRLQKMLADAGVPEDIGIDRERLHLSYGQARKIRSRYTVLDLVAEAG